MSNINNNPVISVIIPVYNVETYLPHCIDSVLNQSFSDFELILIDDGSSDNCPAICDEYAKRDPRINVIHQSNAGVSAARNTGIDTAVGEWISFVDSDDWLHKDYFKFLLTGSLNDTDIVICDCLITSNQYENDYEYDNIVFNGASLKDIYANRITRTRVWGKLFRRNVIGNVRFIIGTEPAEDICFNELLYSNEMKFQITSAKLYYYFMRSDSAIHTHMGRETLNCILVLIEQLKQLKNKEGRKKVILRCYKILFSARYAETFSNDYQVVKSQCKQLMKKLSIYLTELSAEEQIVIHVFYVSPLIYRIWRIIDDPSLIPYEKEQRKLTSKYQNKK